jgi:RimJ/RimL family protein N-acetyltransferase
MKFKLSNPSYSLRPIGEKDMPSLLEMYASTRQQEMARVVNWTDLMKSEFLSSQFDAQHTYYQLNYPGADFWVICQAKRNIGRLYLHENFQGRGLRIIDITLLPEYRNKGIGTTILKDLMGRSAELDRALTIHVESFNPAKVLYARLGFNHVSETNGIYHLMEWKHTI